MEAENALALIQFWLTAESFHTHSLVAHPPTTSVQHQQQQQQQFIESSMEDAIAIYDRYYTHQSLLCSPEVLQSCNSAVYCACSVAAL